MDTTEELDGVREEELKYFAEQLKKSGKYQVTPISRADHAYGSYHARAVTSSSTRQYRERNDSFTGTRNRSAYVASTPVCGTEYIDPKPVAYQDFEQAWKPRGYDNSGDKAPPIPPSPWLASVHPNIDVSRIHRYKEPELSQFSGEYFRGQCDFETWKYDLNCIIRSGAYPENAILEAIRLSLKGRARTVLLHLGERVGVLDILKELEGIYGSVASIESIKEQFYSARQESNETVADYSLRLVQLLCRFNIPLNNDTKNDMLRNRLWSGLRDGDLRNASRYKFESVLDFNQLRRELRVIEQDLLNFKGTQQPEKRVIKSGKAGQFTSPIESYRLHPQQEITDKMKQLNCRVENMERRMQDTQPSASEYNMERGKYQSYKKSNGRKTDQGNNQEQKTKQVSEKKIDSARSQNDLNIKESLSQGR